MFKRILTYSILTLIALGGFFGNVHTDSSINTKGIISISFEGSTTYAADPAPAADPAKKEATATDATKMYNSLIDGMNIVLGVITVIVSPAIMFAGWLMSPDWTSGDLFGLRTPMYKLWVTVSNIVYFIYAILLILIALGTMFGQDKFSYKVMLPKLALGILMVPFTWWFVQWTISIASVVTASVITIPAETMNQDGKPESKLWTIPSIPKKIIIDETGAGGTKKDEAVCPQNCISPKDFLTDSAGMYGYMMVYAYSIFKFQDVEKLNGMTDIIKAGVGIVHQGIVAAIMFIVFGLLTLALVAMLLVRAIKLWVYAIFSPLFTFRFVAGSNLMGGDSSDSFTIKEFIGLAFVPAIVGLSLSFGLIMINAVSGGKPSGTNTVTTCDAPKIESTTGCELASIMGNPKNKIVRKIINPKTPEATTLNTISFGGIDIEFRGKAGPSQDEAEKSNTATGVLNSAGGIFGTLIIDIIALVFIWMAFMAAKNVSKAVSMAVQPFEDMGKKIGGLASSIPKYTPIPGLGMSMSGMEKGIGKVEQGFKDNRANEDAKSPLGQLMGLEAAARKETVKAIEDIRNTNQSGLTDMKVGEAMKQVSLESKGNKVEKTADLINAVLEKYATKDDKGKITGFHDTNEMRSRLATINIMDRDREAIEKIYIAKGSITKGYLENERSDIYQRIHKNESAPSITNETNRNNNPSGGTPPNPPIAGGTPPNPPIIPPPAH